MSFTARLWNQQRFAYCPHTSVSGETWTCQRTGTTTGAGAAGGTTLVDSNLIGSADFYNGAYFVEILSGDAAGSYMRIVDDDGAGTVTFQGDGYENQIASGTEYRLWLSPDPVVVVDSSGGATDVVDAVRAEADDFWNGYYMVAVSGGQVGRIALITDHVSASGTFTLAAASGSLGFSSSLTAGDVCVIRKFVEVSGATAGVTQEYLPRANPRVNFSMGDGVVGARGGSVSFTTRIRPSGTVAAAGARAGASTISGLFQAAGLEEVIDTTSAIVTGSTTSAINITNGEGSNYTVGNMVMVNGNATFITNIGAGTGTEDVINVSPPLPYAPAAADELNATRMYKKTTTGDTKPILIEMEYDGVQMIATGCYGNVTGADAGTIDLSWDMSVSHWVRFAQTTAYDPGEAYATAPPVLAKDRKAYLDTTGVNISGFTFSPGTESAARNVQGAKGINGNAGFQLTNYAAGGTWQEILDTSTGIPQEYRFRNRNSRDLSVIFGSHGETVAVRIPVARIIELPNPADQDGFVSVPNVFAAHDAGQAPDETGTLQKVPDWAIFIS